MKILNFNFNIKGRDYRIVYDPLTNLVYHEEMEAHFKNFRNPKHPYQNQEFDVYPTTVDAVEPFISTHCNRLVLNLTNQCNLRCRYCVFSEDIFYKDQRTHNDSNMTEKVLEDSIEFYKKLKKGKLRKEYISIGFYGGEPTLKPNLIKKSVHFAKEAFNENKVIFLLTTNGTFYKNDDLIKFIIDNEITIHISLDGPEEENDKFRVYKHGKGVYKDLKKLLEKMGDHRIFLQSTLHPNYDWRKIDMFFSEMLYTNKTYNMILNIFSLIGYIGMDYADLRVLMNSKNKNFQDVIIKKLMDGKRLSLYEESYIDLFKKSFQFDFRPYFSKKLFLNSCFPGGDKLFIDPIGDIYICEKVDMNFKIGNIYEGFDKKKILDFWEMSKNIFFKLGCSECCFHNFCSQCFALLEFSKGKTYFGCDDSIKESIMKTLRFLIEIELIKEVNECEDKK